MLKSVLGRLPLHNSAKLISDNILRMSVVGTSHHFSTGHQMNNISRVDNIIIVGSGLMGSGVAQSCATSGKFNSITVHDVSNEALDKAKNRIGQSLTKMKEQKRVNVDDVDKVVNRITFSTDLKPVSEENLLILEAIPELLGPKQQLFKQLYEKFGANRGVIFATNTSSLAVYEIGKYIDAKERYAGLHFFNPVPLMKLVEIVRVRDGTNENTYNALVQFVKDIDKVSVTAKDTPGFIVNRLLVPYMQEAVKMLERGDATARDIDTAMKLGAGYPMGPFELMDYVGLDTNKFIVDAWIARGDPDLVIYKSKLIDSLVQKGHLGKKTGKGFYDYSSKK